MSTPEPSERSLIGDITRLLNWRQHLLDLADRLRGYAGAPPANYQSLAALAEQRRKDAPPAPPPPFTLDVELPKSVMPEEPPVVRDARSHIGDRLRDPASVRDAIVLKEILDKPRALRRNIR